MNIIKSYSATSDKIKLLEEFTEIAKREGGESKVIMELIEGYVKTHGDGNPMYPLERWQEDPDFKAVPAFFRDDEVWVKHYKEANEKERTQLRIKAMKIPKLFRMVDFNEMRKM